MKVFRVLPLHTAERKKSEYSCSSAILTLEGIRKQAAVTNCYIIYRQRMV